MFSSWLFLAPLVAQGLYLKYKNRDYLDELSKKVGFIVNTTWAIETLDIIKDWIYLYVFKHEWWVVLILVFSIVAPFSFADSVGVINAS